MPTKFYVKRQWYVRGTNTATSRTLKDVIDTKSNPAFRGCWTEEDVRRVFAENPQEGVGVSEHLLPDYELRLVEVVAIG